MPGFRPGPTLLMHPLLRCIGRYWAPKSPVTPPRGRPSGTIAWSPRTGGINWVSDPRNPKSKGKLVGGRKNRSRYMLPEQYGDIYWGEPW